MMPACDSQERGSQKELPCRPGSFAGRDVRLLLESAPPDLRRGSQLESRSFHENLERRETVKGSSDRGFGLVFAVFFSFIGAIQLWIGHRLAVWWFGGAAIFLAIALLRPALLAPLNRLWIRLGMLLFHVVNPLVMGIIYYSCVVPIGLIMRALGKDLLRLKFDQAEKSYWIPREPPGPPPDSMKNQF